MFLARSITASLVVWADRKHEFRGGPNPVKLFTDMESRELLSLIAKSSRPNKTPDKPNIGNNSQAVREMKKRGEAFSLAILVFG
ncbi:MAG: hypothetical protein JSW39_06955 [Desulfobacterales bacterium]|nr:MAG: hypothetical protein JSW39_06955 [Desulfobacterales bacterium]